MSVRLFTLCICVCTVYCKYCKQMATLLWGMGDSGPERVHMMTSVDEVLIVESPVQAEAGTPQGSFEKGCHGVQNGSGLPKL